MEPVESSPQSSRFKLTAVNTLVATLAGLISITGGLYSLKSNVFSGQGVGSLSGIVRDEAIAKPLMDASVEISNANNLILGTYHTDLYGHYEVNKLKEGPYILKVSAVKHVPQIKTITVVRDQAATIHFDLTPIAEETEPPVGSRSPLLSPPAVPSHPASYSSPAARSISPIYSPTRGNDQPRETGSFVENAPRPTWQDDLIQPMPSYSSPGQAIPSQPVYSQPQVNSPTVTQALLQTGIQLVSDWAERKRERKSSQTLDSEDDSERESAATF